MPILLCLWSIMLPIYVAYVNVPMLICLCYNAYVNLPMLMPMLICLCYNAYVLLCTTLFGLLVFNTKKTLYISTKLY